MTDAKGGISPGFPKRITSYEWCTRCNDGWIEAGQWPCPECRGTSLVAIDWDESSEDYYEDEDDERESSHD